MNESFGSGAPATLAQTSTRRANARASSPDRYLPKARAEIIHRFVNSDPADRLCQQRPRSTSRYQLPDIRWPEGSSQISPGRLSFRPIRLASRNGPAPGAGSIRPLPWSDRQGNRPGLTDCRANDGVHRQLVMPALELVLTVPADRRLG